MDEIFILNYYNYDAHCWEFVTSTDNLTQIVLKMLTNDNKKFQILVNDYTNRNKPKDFIEWAKPEQIGAEE